MTTRRETRRRRHVKSYFSIYIIPRFIVDNTFILSHKDDYNTCSSTHAHVASALSSVSPSPFAVPSRESASKSREETTHTTTINTADEGTHVPLSREDEDQADLPLGGDIEMRSVGPDRDRDQGLIEVCLSPSFSYVCIHSQRNRVQPPLTSRCVQITPMMRTPHRCVLLYPSLHVRINAT